ncbi:hypothetical protein KL907_000688 [Ogataea polymorpha]|uniref:Uncharacterized protein n=1 Tax=Ogataea polymorpha TaxID=460523 RepID=A0A1B7SIB9_9ASCO|nr:uncharacterized protein OGAPODRAFT_16019 [Ogataea polymorpha]KAG7882083.1 hypothetical protein KL937_000654 [Ogataea polymorpha]KAG7895186.1 hypothetical protein KL908_001536 [Ogataea polymorpha]KAG7911680.1 hypothetical protein KL906_001001 [Ogataea polymorpha]KAG7912486.1 hypothetical protein KL907_000688 [Ogataea polymorpha]KAG7937342.1 hypothetical protein KL934_001545 [Ogataea polymorpha]
MNILALLVLSALAQSFSVSVPSFPDTKDIYPVASVEKPPHDFLARIKSHTKQTVLASNQSAQNTLAWQQGMAFIYAESSNEAYTVNVTVGKDTLPLLIDTGSAYLWVYGANCTDSSCENKQLYQMSSAQDSGSSFKLSYSSGSASGSVVSDSLQLAGITADNFSFGVASQVPDLFEDYSFAGVLGLPATNTTDGMTNLVTFLQNQGSVEKGVFALCLGTYNTTDGDSNAGLLVLGSDVAGLYDGSITYAPVVKNTNNYWQVAVDSISVDGYAVSFDTASVDGDESSTKRLAVIDSGTTSIVTASADATKLHSFFNNSITDGSNFALPCNTTYELAFEIGGQKWTIGPEDYLGSAYSSGSQYSGYCVSNIVGSSSLDNGTWILGSQFLKNYYVSFDLDSAKVGLANRSDVKIDHSVSPSSVSSLPHSQTTVAASAAGHNSSTTPSSHQTLTPTTLSIASSSVAGNASASSSSSSSIMSGWAGRHRLAPPMLLLSLLCLL